MFLTQHLVLLEPSDCGKKTFWVSEVMRLCHLYPNKHPEKFTLRMRTASISRFILKEDPEIMNRISLVYVFVF